VCQSLSGRWTVVGLVTWGVGCANDIPGIYSRMTFFRDWIEAN
jgi:secreted trypsin-like serine protease